MTILFPGVQESTVPSTSVTTSAVNSQDLGSGTARTLVTGSVLAVPNGGLQVGAKIKFRAVISKTGAGTASSTFDIGIGATGTTADAATVAFSTGTQTGVADAGVVDIEAIVTSLGTSTTTGHITGTGVLLHNLASTGLAPTPAVVVTDAITNADLTLADALFVGLYVTEGTGNDITVVSVGGSLSSLSTGASG
jgi:hypothetical protein